MQRLITVGTRQVIAPAIHINGTSKKALNSELERAYLALTDAIAAVAAAAPSGRDYYVQGDDAYHRARIEHNARLDKLQQVYSELAEICFAVNVS